MREIGIYVHIPFCKQKCKYCDFVSFSNIMDKQEQYVNCLLDEIDNWNEVNFKVNTIYFGGGTPSIISEDLIVKILNKIKEKFDVKEDCEITIEANPGTVDIKKLKTYKEAGFNRISIGLQSASDKILKSIGRIHNYEEFKTCFKLAREVGFENINVDLMLGLPNQSINDLIDSLNKVIFLNPNHISIYSLILEENTILEKEVRSGLYLMPTDEEERDMYNLAKKTLEKNGYIHYEISNFARKGYESKHNMNCWNQEEYLGFGLASHSYFNKKRFSNTDDLDKYISNRQENVSLNEIQDSEMERKEYMMLGFRKLSGISISEFERKFEINPLFYFRFEISKLVDEGLIEVDLDNIRLTRKGLDLANLVFEKFI